MTADPYARITELDETTVARLADRIAIRAADPRQQRLWRDFLARPSFGPGDRVLEVGRLLLRAHRVRQHRGATFVHGRGRDRVNSVRSSRTFFTRSW
jgi:hypothetical protein